MINKIKVGDTIEIEQAWEDEAGQDHDEFAEVLAIDRFGYMKLKFNRKEITDFLEGAEFNVRDYQDKIEKPPEEGK